MTLQCLIDHICPTCAQTVCGPGFFRHAISCCRLGQSDFETLLDHDYRGGSFQHWKIERRIENSDYLVPVEPLQANFKSHNVTCSSNVLHSTKTMTYDPPAPLTGGV